MAKENHTAPPREFQLFTTFAQSLRDLFGDPNLTKNSMTAMESLTQTGTVAEYISQFEALCQYATYNSDVTETRMFYRGLRPNVKDKVYWKEYGTLKELQALTIKCDIRLQERNAERAVECNQAQNAGTTQPPAKPTYAPRPTAQPTGPPRATTEPQPLAASKPNTGTRPTPAPHPNLTRPALPARSPTTVQWDGSTPMELDTQGYRHITAEEKEHRRTGNLCLYCSQPGHVTRNCPFAPQMGWRTAAIEI